MLKTLLKSLVNSSAGQQFLGALIFVYGNLVWYTSKIKIENGELPQAFWTEGKPVIVAVWHGRLLLMSFLFSRGVKVSALISEHRDGKIVRNAAQMYGHETVAGSTTRGAVAAFRKLIRRAEMGHTIFITPDGPKGPRMRLSKGTTELSRQTGLPIFAASISCDTGTIAHSWDRFMIPKPFGTIYVNWKNLGSIDKNASAAEREAFRNKVELEMITQQTQTDHAIGRLQTIEPGKENA